MRTGYSDARWGRGGRGLRGGGGRRGLSAAAAAHGCVRGSESQRQSAGSDSTAGTIKKAARIPLLILLLRVQRRLEGKVIDWTCASLCIPHDALEK